MRSLLYIGGLIAIAAFIAFVISPRSDNVTANSLQGIDSQPWFVLSANGGTTPSCNQTRDTPQGFITFAVQSHWGEKAIVLERDQNNQIAAIEIDTSPPGPTGSMYFFRTDTLCLTYLAKMQKHENDQLDRALQQIR